MQATQNSSTTNRNGNAVPKNSALPDPKKVNSPTNSKYGKSKSTTNLTSEHQRSENKNLNFPEVDHQENQVELQKKDVAKKKAQIQNETINLYDKKEFEKIQSHDSSETTISYSYSSNAESYANTKKNDLLEEKTALDKKFEHLKKKQSATENKGGREYENRGRE